MRSGLIAADAWEPAFERSRRQARRALEQSNTATVLAILFDRLYVLRNQLVHGGATWGSAVNRPQVRDGARILAFLVPRFIDLMLDHPEAEWGPVFYPLVEE